MTTHVSIRKHGLEHTTLALTIVAAAITWLVIFFSEGGLGLTLALVVGAWIAQAVLLARATVNSVHVGPQQLPKLWSAYVTVGVRLGITDLPPLYLQQSGGVLNAFAARLARRMVVVLQSGLVEALEHDLDALEFVIGHELGHHLARHTTVARHLATAPLAMFGLAPFQLGLSRGQELTADRYGFHGSRDLHAAERGIMVILGGRLAGAADPKAVEAQWQTVSVLARLLELVRTHPNLPRRVAQLHEYARAHRRGPEERAPYGETGWAERAGTDAASRPLATTLVGSGFDGQSPRAG